MSKSEEHLPNEDSKEEKKEVEEIEKSDSNTQQKDTETINRVLFQQNEELRSDNVKLEREREGLKEKFEKFKKKYRKMKQERKKFQSTVKKIREENNQIRLERESLMLKNDDFIKEIANLKTEDQTHQEEVHKLLEQVDDLQKKIQEKNHYETNMKGIHRNNTLLKEKLFQYESKINKLEQRDEMNNSERSQLNTKLRNCQDLVKNLEMKISTLTMDSTGKKRIFDHTVGDDLDQIKFLFAENMKLKEKIKELQEREVNNFSKK